MVGETRIYFNNSRCITFSIDGLEDTNKIYRINSEWESIMNGFNTIKKYGIKTVWKFIVFRHNQHQIEEAKN
jgi:sulfatase maturation enzyme AslB (radical SAM superfamily)